MATMLGEIQFDEIALDAPEPYIKGYFISRYDKKIWGSSHRTWGATCLVDGFGSLLGKTKSEDEMLAAIDNVYFETTKGDRSAFYIYLVPSCCLSRYCRALRPCSDVTEGGPFLTQRSWVEKREERAESGKELDPSQIRGERDACQKG